MNIQLSKATTKGLRGTQSVRATFRLTKQWIGAIQIVAAHLGIQTEN